MEAVGIPYYIMLIPKTLVLILALLATCRTYYKYPTKRWRFLALVIWLGIAMITQIGASIFFLLPSPSSEQTFRVIHWIDETVAVIGYLSVAVTLTLIGDFYRRLGYGK